MIDFLTDEEIKFINEYSLKITNEEKNYNLDNANDLNFLMNFVEEEFKDPYKISLAYCVSIIVLHPFRNGNHRTSILSAEHFLLKNNYESFTNDKKDTELEKWRIDYESKYDLEREFFRITCIEDDEKRKEEIKKIIDSEYGKYIEKWLRDNYKKV